MKKALYGVFLVCIFFIVACSEENTKKEVKVPVQVKKPLETKKVEKSVKKEPVKEKKPELKKEKEQLKAASILPPKKVAVKKTFYQQPKEEVIYKRVLFPFFENVAELPYSLKIKAERLAYRLNYLKKKKRSISIIVKGYASRNEKGNLLRLAFLRAKNTALYLSWKSSVSMQYFTLLKAITNKGGKKYRRRVIVTVKVK